MMIIILGIVEADTIKHGKIRKKKEKIRKRIPKENEKTIRNQMILLKSHQKGEYLGCPPCKIFGTILQKS